MPRFDWIRENVPEAMRVAEPHAMDHSADRAMPFDGALSLDLDDSLPNPNDCGGLLITWQDLEAAFLDMDPRLCDAAWRAGDTPLSPGCWTFSFRSNGERRFLRRTLRTAGLKFRGQTAAQPLPGGRRARPADLVDTWLTALANSEVLTAHDNRQWEIGGRVIYALPVASALLCRRLMRTSQ